MAEAGALPPDQAALILRIDQRQRWRRGDRVPAESYLERYPQIKADPEINNTVIVMLTSVGYWRELSRLEAALHQAAVQRSPDQPWIVMLHYPPFTSDGQPTAFVEAITQAKPSLCLYGHLHRSAEWQQAINGTYEGVDYQLVAADFIEMIPKRVL